MAAIRGSADQKLHCLSTSFFEAVNEVLEDLQTNERDTIISVQSIEHQREMDEHARRLSAAEVRIAAEEMRIAIEENLLIEEQQRATAAAKALMLTDKRARIEELKKLKYEED